jgi:hypothetical protein
MKPVKSHPKWTASVITLLIFAGAGFWLWNNAQQKEKQRQKDITAIKEYVEGIELDTAKLSVYKGQLQKINNSKDSIKRKKLNAIITKINQVNDGLRRYIREANFVELKKYNYSKQQEKFKQSVDKIDSASYKAVGDSLTKENLEKVDLNKIAKKIDSIDEIIKEKNKPKETPDKTQVKENKKDKTTTPTNSNKEFQSSANSGKSGGNPPQSSKSSSGSTSGNTSPSRADSIKAIKKELQSDNITRKQLEDYKTGFAGNSELGKSIDLYLDFWKLVKSNQKTEFDDLLQKVKRENILQTSELRIFLDRICENSQTFSDHYNSKRSNIKITQNTTLNDLKKMIK